CVTRSSRKKLIKPFEEPEQVFHSLRRLFRTPSLDQSNPPRFELFFYQEDQFEEEITETMGEPTIEDGSKNKDANERIERFLEIVDIFTTPDVTQDQLMLCVFPITLTGTASRWLRNEPAGSITRKILKGKFLSKYCPPTWTAKKMEEIKNFQQAPDETLY
ncbi:retrovirus-related pol polyprotein from transposon TNT 1-94, partial [Tanacetum coccineum]